MRRLKKGTITLISINWTCLVMLFNIGLICGCINGYYDGIYVIGVGLFITWLSMFSVILLQELKEMRF